MTDKCESCGVPFTDHLGLVGTCKKLQEAIAERDEANEECREKQTIIDRFLESEHSDNAHRIALVEDRDSARMAAQEFKKERDAAIAAKEKAEKELEESRGLLALKSLCDKHGPTYSATEMIAEMERTSDALARAEKAERELDATESALDHMTNAFNEEAQMRLVAQARVRELEGELKTVTCRMEFAESYAKTVEGFSPDKADGVKTQARVRELEALLSEVRWDAKDADGLPQDEFNCLMRRIDAALGGWKS